MEALAIKTPCQAHGKALVQGETSGENIPLIPPTMEGEGVIPRSNGSFIPSTTDGARINPKHVNLNFPKFDRNDPTH
jgi:hypothetical protein